MESPMNWQTMDTMPEKYRDGRDVLLLSYECDDASVARWSREAHAWVCRYDGRNAHDSGGTVVTVSNPDRWSPLPTHKES